MNLTPIFEAAIPEMSRRQSAVLGDRTKYCGSSDLGCLRKAYLQRLYPKQPDVSMTLRQIRGHAAEIIVEKILESSNIPFDTQVELVHPDYQSLRAHVDLVLYDKDSIHCVEVKSLSSIPENGPYPSHVDQLAFQLGMMKLMYPAATITGSVLLVDVNAGEIMQHNGYEHDEVIFNSLVCKGLQLLDALQGEGEPYPSPSLLCGYCQFREDCPSMRMPKVHLPIEVEMLVGKYAELIDIRGRAEKELKSIRQELVSYTGPSFKGRSDNYDLTVTSVDAGVAVDSALLKSNYRDVYNCVLKPRAGYSRLEVRPLKKSDAMEETT